MDRREFVAARRRDAVRRCARALSAAPSALVTCDAEARLAVVDLGSYQGRSLDPTRCRTRARSSSSGGRAVVCHTAMGAVSIVDRRGVRHVLHGFAEPRYTAAHPDGRHAFVTDSGRSGVVAIDVLRGIEVGRVRLPGWARHVTIDSRGERLWVGLGSARPTSLSSTLGRLRHASTLTPGFRAHDVGLAPDGRVWITGGRLATARGRQRGARTPTAAPQHVTFVERARLRDERRLRHAPRAGPGRAHACARSAIPIGSYNVQFGAGRVITRIALPRHARRARSHAARCSRVVRVAGSCHDACLLPR